VIVAEVCVGRISRAVYGALERENDGGERGGVHCLAPFVGSVALVEVDLGVNMRKEKSDGSVDRAVRVLLDVYRI
jgi:hypothetical protein